MLRERLGKELLYFDGGMGTLLQERGLQPGELPETWNLLHAEEIREIHRKYIEAGSDIVLTNTFGANALKFHCQCCSRPCKGCSRTGGKWTENLYCTGYRSDRKALETNGRFGF